MTKEQKFYKVLQDVFIGAKIEGEGGFINLMRIKSSYYSQIEKLLKDDIDNALEKYPKFREELFDKLYSFFSRYFTESGSIYFNSTPFHNNIYEKVYTDEKDVILFWKTQMLYYVKTDRIFRGLPVEFPSDRGVDAEGGRGVLKFYFDASKIEAKKANEKRSLVFELSNVREDDTIVFGVSYSERGAKTKQYDILKAIKRKGLSITEEQLERAFRVFEKQSEVDFFINKNAKAFLQEQFKLWSYQYFWEGAKEWSADRVNQLQILKDIAFKIIDFISQFEDELVKIWNKPKFVKNSNYVITLDKIYKNSPSLKGWQAFPSEKGVDAAGGRGVFRDGVVKWNELPYNPDLKEKARELRKAGNLSEVLLWNQLKNKQFLGLDFDRQKIIGNYIGDFYCKNLGVVIEIDGVSHDGKIEYDKQRDSYLKNLGLRVIHISDLDVKKNLEGVLEYLRNELITPRPSDTPLKEGNNTPSFRDTPLKEGNLVEKILKHKNIKDQIKEWQELGIVDEKFKIEDVFENSPLIKGWQSEGLTGYLTEKHLSKKYEHLPIDTKYFKDLELEILALFDDLDNQLDGWLIKSENYQALNTILPKFKERVQTIYIDPPFNLDSSDQFLYRTNYKDANWATLLENRLKLAKDILDKKGSIFVRCDYNGNWIVRCLMDDGFGKENFRNEIIINKSIRIKTEGKKFPTWHDSFYFYSKEIEKSFFRHITKQRLEEEWRSIDTEGESWGIVPKEKLHLFSKKNIKIDEKGNPITRARIILGKEILPREGRRFPSQDVIDDLERQNRIRISSNSNPQMLKPSEIYLTDNWSDSYGYASEWDFTTENSEISIKRPIEATSNYGDIVFDFFLGSGTTTAVAHKLGRKWVGVEMGEHFYSVVLPRMKKVLAYDKSGISKEVKEYQGGGFFKYYELEQYEEALSNCKYKDGDLFNAPGRSPYQEYVFMKDEKMLKVLEIDYKKEKVKVDLTKLYPNIDIAETLSNLTGKWIKRINGAEVEFKDGTKIKTKDLDYKIIKPLIWW